VLRLSIIFNGEKGDGSPGRAICEGFLKLVDRLCESVLSQMAWFAKWLK
jgi:hypothetical protein